jgi:hypothetical protein
MIYGIEDKTLTALGDAVRNKVLGKDIILYQDTTFYDVNQTTSLYSAWQNMYKSPYIKMTIHSIEIIHSIENSHLTWSEGGGSISYNLLAPGALPFTIITNISGYFYASDINCNINVSFECVDENGEPYKYSPIEMTNMINDLSIIPPTALNLTDNC